MAGVVRLVMLLGLSLVAGSQAASAQTSIDIPRTYGDIVDLQLRLRDAGCYTGPIDGIAGPRTRDAVACLERQTAVRSPATAMPPGTMAPPSTGLPPTAAVPPPAVMPPATPPGAPPVPEPPSVAQPAVAVQPGGDAIGKLAAGTDCSKYPPQPVACHPEWPSLVLYAQNFPPYVEKGVGDSITGPIPQVIWTVCERMGRNCLLKYAPVWQAARQDARDGKVDGLIVLLWTQQSEQFLIHSAPVVRGEYGLFVRADDPLPSREELDVKALDGYRILTYSPSGTADSAQEFVQQAQRAGVTMAFEPKYTSTELALLELANSTGKVAVYSNRAVGDNVSKQLELPTLRYAGRDKPLVYHIGFSLKTVPPEVVAAFDRAFVEACAQGAVQRYYRDVQPPASCRR